MKTVYKDDRVIDQIRRAVYESQRSGRNIKMFEISRYELEEIKRDLGVHWGSHENEGGINTIMGVPFVVIG